MVKKFAFSCLMPFFAGLLFSISSAYAQTDSTGARLVRGTPRFSSEVGGIVTGATVLPYSIPSGTYRNRAAYPLMLTMMIPNWQGNGTIYVDGRLVNRMSSADSGSNAAISAIVPSGSEFKINFDTVVTAMSSTGKWADTQITFPIRSWYTATYFKTPASFQSVKDCVILVTNADYGQDQINSVVLSSNSCGTLRRTSGISIVGFLDGRGVYSYGPAQYPSAYLWSQGSVYSRDIYSNVYTCRASRLVEDNYNNVYSTWNMDLFVPYHLPRQQSCTPTVVQEIHQCGSIGCSVPIFDSP